MLLKVTLKFSFYCVILFIYGCKESGKFKQEQEMLRVQDSVSESRIDSAYAAINRQCDTLMVYRVPEMVDSLLGDSAGLPSFFYNRATYSDADKKVEKVIRRLLADCDSSLQKETYRIARLRQKAKPVRRIKKKV